MASRANLDATGKGHSDIQSGLGEVEAPGNIRAHAHTEDTYQRPESSHACSLGNPTDTEAAKTMTPNEM